MQPLLSSDQSLVVKYGGQLQYDELHAELHKCHVGIVTESHLHELKAMASASLQTKINDYYLAGLPVWCIGPVYGACKQFILDNNIGTSFTAKQPDQLADAIRLVCDTDTLIKIKNSAREFLISNNDFITIKTKLLTFLYAK